MFEHFVSATEANEEKRQSSILDIVRKILTDKDDDVPYLRNLAKAAGFTKATHPLVGTKAEALTETAYKIKENRPMSEARLNTIMLTLYAYPVSPYGMNVYSV